MDDNQKKEMLGKILNAALARKYIRLARPVTQREWAQQLGVSPTSLTDWISGTRLVQGNNLMALLDDPDIQALADQGADTDLFKLFGVPRGVTDPLLRQVLAAMSTMPPEERCEWAQRIEAAAAPHRFPAPAY